ncbi:MAG TPA: hypothetical protein VKU01_13770 [Bryobacteraceae bacterium]|nr:hypothetical protein [Bryobacteraceae bacterium]
MEPREEIRSYQSFETTFVLETLLRHGFVGRSLFFQACEQSGPRIARMSAGAVMIRKLKSGEYRLYSRKKDARTGRRRNLGTFSSREAAQQHEREVQFFKRRG